MISMMSMIFVIVVIVMIGMRPRHPSIRMMVSALASGRVGSFRFSAVAVKGLAMIVGDQGSDERGKRDGSSE